MSKAVQRNADKKKLPFALQRLLNNARKDDGAPLLGEMFGLSYEHNRRLNIVNSKEFQDEMNAIHASNPFKEVAYGRGKFTYVPIELAAKIDAVHSKFNLDVVSEENKGKGWSYVSIEIGEKPANVPPNTDHTKFLQLVQAEDIYASEEEREVMKKLLIQMDTDLEASHGTDVHTAPAA
jgi:hypothetical protein